MALERRKNKPTNGWSAKFSVENTKTSHQLPVLVGKSANIDYSVLEQLCSIKGLGNRKYHSTEEAHETFMKNYSRIFPQNDEKLPALDLKAHNITGKLHNGSTQTLHSSSQQQQEIFIPHDHHEPHFCENYDYQMSHNIRDHMALLHKENIITQSAENLLKTKVKLLKRLLKKLPFERKRSDQDAIYCHLQYFPELTDRIPSRILRELSGIIQIEKWNDAGYTVISNDEINLIIKGSVTPIDGQKLATWDEQKAKVAKSDEKQEDVEKLVTGQCFGDFGGSLGEHVKNTVNSVMTLSPCEFIKIIKRDYDRMRQVVENKETNQKLQLVQSCRLFQNWPKGALSKVVDLISWKAFRPGQVLVNEGESCEVIGFLYKGVCLLKRSIVVKARRDGTKTCRQKQVIVGKLNVGDSFGECTILRGQLIPYSVVTASYVQLGIISQHDFNEVDEVTKSLLRQCYDEIDNNLSEDELQQQYVKQQKQHEWINFKKNVLNEVILYRSILPGYGKWSRNPTMQDVAELAYDG